MNKKEKPVEGKDIVSVVQNILEENCSHQFNWMFECVATEEPEDFEKCNCGLKLARDKIVNYLIKTNEIKR